MAETILQTAPGATEFNRFIREHRLMASRCMKCGSLQIQPRSVCTGCLSEQLEWVETSGRGGLSAFTVIYSGPTFMVEQGFDRAHPYISGIVTLEEGTSFPARILGLEEKRPEEIAIGTPLRVDFIDYGVGEEKKTYLAFRVV